MKKALFLMFIIFAIILITVSCEIQNPSAPGANMSKRSEDSWSLTLENLERMVDNDIDKKSIATLVSDDESKENFSFDEISYKYKPGVVRKKGEEYYSIYKFEDGDYCFFFFSRMQNGELYVQYSHFISDSAPDIEEFKNLKIGSSTKSDVDNIIGGEKEIAKGRYFYPIGLNDGSTLDIEFEFDTKIIVSITHMEVEEEIIMRACEKDLHL